jgi:hypothetical protein
MTQRDHVVGVLLLAAMGFAATGCKEAGWGSGGELRVHIDGKTLSVWELERGDTPYAVFLVFGEFSGTTNFKTGKSEGVIHALRRWGIEAPGVSWSCVMRDGVSGTVTIGEEAFDLSKGRLFQVDFDGDKPVVTQYALDCNKWRGENCTDRVEALADASPEVRRFADQWQKAEQPDAADSR